MKLELDLTLDEMTALAFCIAHGIEGVKNNPALNDLLGKVFNAHVAGCLQVASENEPSVLASACKTCGAPVNTEGKCQHFPDTHQEPEIKSGVCKTCGAPLNCEGDCQDFPCGHRPT